MFEFLKQVSSLEKVFMENDRDFADFDSMSALGGEEISYQIVFRLSDRTPSPTKISVSVKCDEIEPEVFRVVNVPVGLAAYPDCSDDGYISKQPGLYPDLLLPLENGAIYASAGVTYALWVSVRLPKNAGYGKITVSSKLSEQFSGECADLSFEIDSVGVPLPENDLPVTLWFHNDCIASAHKTSVFSERHWQLTELYMKAASDIGMNMILTPIFTPPLDTTVGGERPTAQLVDVIKKGKEYDFGFEKFDRYIQTALRCGMKYFEISHLFTQWGAEHAPKIIAVEDGEQKRIFGWETDLRDGEYGAFLDAFLLSFTAHIKELGIAENCFFHISDEPNGEMLDNYKYAKSLVSRRLEGFKIIDALSNFEYYSEGAVELPVVATDRIEPFLDAKADIFCYYCCAQGAGGVANRFIAMPSARNRILAYQMYKYNVKGFLQWGFNFYYSRLSQAEINPFVTTDADGAFPSGDAFIVYPSESGEPYPSIRAKVFKEMLEDFSAMKLLDAVAGESVSVGIAEKYLGDIEFFNSTPSEEAIIAARRAINSAISELAER